MPDLNTLREEMEAAHEAVQVARRHQVRAAATDSSIILKNRLLGEADAEYADAISSYRAYEMAYVLARREEYEAKHKPAPKAKPKAAPKKKAKAQGADDE